MFKPNARKNTIGFWVGTTIGLVDIFGVGHILLGNRRRGYVFLGMTAILYFLGLVATLFSEGLWGYLPPVWGVMWLAQTYDLYKLTKEKPRAPEE